MKKIVSLFIVLLSFGLFSCGDRDEPNPSNSNVEMSITPQDLMLDSKFQTAEIVITSNVEWGVSSNQHWCKCFPTGGIKGTTAVKVSLEENKQVEDRKVTLIFKSGSFTKEFLVIQRGYTKKVNIPDANFKAYCIANFDTDKDDEISIYEALEIKSLDVSSKGISSLQGIEYFKNLTTLICKDNNIESLDISELKFLENLNCADNQLKELSIISNLNLEKLDCTNNPLLTKVFVWTGFVPSSLHLKPNTAQYLEPEVPTPAGYTMVGQEEFNAPLINGKSALPNLEKWSYETGAGGWGNNEIQNYIRGVHGKDTCAVVSDGTLKIIAKKVGSEVFSIRMNTKESWKYGYFEARLKMPSGKGVWPAFWMLPKDFKKWPDDGEIDIMEYVGYQPNVTHSSIHTKAYNHKNNTQKTAYKKIANAETTFHVYGLLWTASKIEGYVDGVKYFSFVNDGKNNNDTWAFDKPFYLKLNLAWGGTWGGAEGIDPNVLPATYEVDYVRVFQK